MLALGDMLCTYKAESGSFVAFGLYHGRQQFSGYHGRVTAKRNGFKAKVSRYPIQVVCVEKSAEKVVKSTNAIVDGVVKGAVNGLTEFLNLVRLGQKGSTEMNALMSLPEGVRTTPQPGDIESVVRIIKQDYKDRAYFVTGYLSDGIYEAECYFADPTISFTGLELWKRNLQLLVPFLDDPSIELIDINVVNDDGKKSLDQGAEIKATWILKTGLRLPWKPDVYVKGSTLYYLSPPNNNKIYKHVESWDISGLQAIGMVLFGTKVRS